MRAPTLRLIAFAGTLLLAGGFVARADPTDAALRAHALSVGEVAPLLRIGLEAGHQVTVEGGRGFRVLDAASGEPAWRESYEAPLHAVAEGGPSGEVPSVYRVQVGAFGSQDAAEAERRRLGQRVGAEGVVHHDPDRGTWRVRLGAAEERIALAPLVERLRAEGVESPWIAQEPVEAAVSGVGLRLVDARFESKLIGAGRLVVLPAKGSRVAVDGRTYRGVVELRVSAYGTVRPVNWIGIEQYLRGVVPAELGPEVWPQPAALAAQAVAARTYAWRNRRQFADEGFDLCATPRCQVYAGAGAEHPMSDRAVAETRNRILVHEGEPIVALYTATCGGHTEAGAEIFPEHDRPYLRGVPCRAENDALGDLRGTLRGRPVEPVVDETGRDVTRDWALLRQSGVIDAARPTPPARSAVDAATLRAWTGALCRLAGRPLPQGAPHEAGSLGSAAAALLADLGWSERSRVLLANADLPALLRDPETEAMSADERRALAYLASVEVLRPYPDSRFRGDEAASGARLAPALVRIGESYRAFGLREGTLSGVGRRSLRLFQGKGSSRLELAQQPALFGRAGGASVPSELLELWPGDRLRYRTNARGAIDFLELLPPLRGASDDRSSRVYSWEVRKTRRELETEINRHVAIGRLKRLEVLRRGVSGRVVELRVVGNRGSTVVRGFDVRRLLDLRESLLVIEPQRDEHGEIEAVVFAGKGWGHGVGLCQVGAYGMALRGSGYREILAHYYPGSELGRLDRQSP